MSVPGNFRLNHQPLGIQRQLGTPLSKWYAAAAMPKASECSPSPTFSQPPPQDTCPMGDRDCTILPGSRKPDQYEHLCNPCHQAGSHRWAIDQSPVSPSCFVDYALQSRHAIVKLMDEISLRATTQATNCPLINIEHEREWAGCKHIRSNLSQDLNLIFVQVILSRSLLALCYVVCWFTCLPMMPAHDARL